MHRRDEAWTYYIIFLILSGILILLPGCTTIKPKLPEIPVQSTEPVEDWPIDPMPFDKERFFNHTKYPEPEEPVEPGWKPTNYAPRPWDYVV